MRENPNQAFESVGKKILRHIKDGDLDFQTILRGMRYVRDTINTRNLGEARVRKLEVQKNFAGVDGVTVTSYTLFVDKDKIHSWALVMDEPLKGKIIVMDLPKDSYVTVVNVDTENYDSVVRYLDGKGIVSSEEREKEAEKFTSDRQLQLHPDAIAQFVGPTYRMYGFFPNNGYYSKEIGQRIPFEDTNPSGMRRGALKIDSEGNFSIITDEEKWKIVRSGFKDCQTLSGTSFYMRSTDSELDAELQQQTERSIVSYVVQWKEKNGDTRTSYLSIGLPLTRLIAKQIIDNHVKDNGGNSWIAAELELLNSGATVKKKDGTLVNATNSKHIARRGDHYLVLRRK